MCENKLLPGPLGSLGAHHIQHNQLTIFELGMEAAFQQSS